VARTLTHLSRPTVANGGFTGTPTVQDLNAGGTKTFAANGNTIVLYETHPRVVNKGASANINNGNAMLLGGEFHAVTPFWDRSLGTGGSDAWPRNKIIIPVGATGTWAARGTSTGTAFAPISVDCTAAQLKTAVESVLGGGSVRVVEDAVVARTFYVNPAPPFNDKLGRMAITTQPTGGTITVQNQGNWFNAGEVGDIQNFNFVHIEGAYIHGQGWLEGLDFFSNNRNSTVQMASCFIDIPMYRTHPDHQHADAIQCYTGPKNFLMEKCHIRCSVNSWMVQPLQVASRIRQRTARWCSASGRCGTASSRCIPTGGARTSGRTRAWMSTRTTSHRSFTTRIS
jgi:hypothetical protein